MKLKQLFFGLCITAMLTSCKVMSTDAVYYQSYRTRHAQPSTDNPIPDDAKIAVFYMITPSGDLSAYVVNRTENIMIIDQTMSFFVGSDGVSTSYYDPTIRTTTTTDLSSTSRGASVNLGSIASAFGIGGLIGNLASGINLGGSGTSGVSTSNTVYEADQPKVSLGPRGRVKMSKEFKIGSILYNGFNTDDYAQSPCRFSVCISYSTDEGATFNKLTTEFFLNSSYCIPVNKGQINDAVVRVLESKPDAINEYLWNMSCTSQGKNTTCREELPNLGTLFDYQ